MPEPLTAAGDTAANALPPGTRLGEFEIRRVLGAGGFGIVYQAFDHALQREVAIKEYMPSSLAGRTAAFEVSLLSSGHQETFALGLKSFVNEARLLARFDHPSLVKVHRFWEANGTAYMVMPLYRGQTLKALRRGLSAPPDEAWLRGVLEPVLGALQVLHGEGVYHRDIAPDNIVMENGRPVLLDFGAARRVIGDGRQALTAILKPSYAPIEQYAESENVRQGPFTDLYALGATMHFAIHGKPPAPSTTRSVHDDQPPLATQAIPGCSPAFLQAIDWMLAPRPADRPQTVAALLDVLRGRASVPGAAAAGAPAPRPAPVSADDDATIVRPAPDTDATVVLPAGSAAMPTPRVAPELAEATRAARPPAPSAPAAVDEGAAPPARRRSLLWPLVGLGVVVAGAAGTVLLLDSSLQGPDGHVASPAPAPAPEPAAAAAPVPAPASAPATIAVETPAPAPAPVTTAAPPAPSASTPAVIAPPAEAPAPAVAAAVTATPPAPAAKPPAPARAAASRPLPSQPPRPSPAIVLPAPGASPAPSPAPAVAVRAAVPAPAPAPAPAVVAPPPATVAKTPRQACGSRVLLALTACMMRECAKPEQSAHPECVAFERSEKERQDRIERGF